METALNGTLSGETIRLKNSVYGQVTPDMPSDYTDEHAQTTMQITGNFTLDLNGYTIGGASGSNVDYCVMLSVGKTGNVTIKNGTLSSPDIDLVFYNGGKAVLENVMIEGHVGIVNEGNLLLDGVTYNSKYGMIQFEGSLRIKDSVMTARNASSIRLIRTENVLIETGIFTGQPVIEMDQATATLNDIVDFDRTFIIASNTLYDHGQYPDMQNFEGTIQLISAHPITVDPKDALEVHGVDWIDHYPAGQDVEVDIAIPEGKALKTLTLNGNDITDQVILYDDTPWGYVSFIMPKEAVELKATYTEDEPEITGHALKLDPAANLKTDKQDLNDIAKVTKVTVTITPPEGKILGTLMANGTDVTDQVKDSKYIFDMPDEDMRIAAAFKEAVVPPEVGYLISVFTIDQRSMRINENGIARVEQLDVAPYIRNDRTMLPVRFVGQSLNMEVTFDEETRDVLVKDATRSVKLNLDNNTVTTGDASRPYLLDSKPEVVAGRTMLPIGEIADILGFSRTDQDNPGGYLTWDGQARTVTIMVQTTK